MFHFGVYETSASADQLQEDKLHPVKPTLSSAASIGKRFVHTQPADLNIADEPAKFHFDADKIRISCVPLYPGFEQVHKIAEKEVVDYSL